jgi:peptide deformylase
VAVRAVLKMGDPILRRVADAVTQVGTPQLDSLVEAMRETMRACGGVGIAAPQIGVSLRIIVFEVPESPRYPDASPIPMTVVVNPVVTPLGGEREESWEGCLSIPDLRGLVPRFRRIRYEGFDPRGGRIDRVVEGFHARIVQHEVDHLNGLLFTERVRDPEGLRASGAPGSEIASAV